MAQSDLDLLIADFSTLNTQNRIRKFLKPKLDELIVSALAVMGVRTIGDTNQAKSIFVMIARDVFGRDISWIYDVPTDLWNNKRAPEANGNYDVITVEQGGIYTEISIDDWGLYGQEFFGTAEELDNGATYPSPRRMGSHYQARHISNTQDDLDDGKIGEFEKILDEIEDLLVARFEGRI